MVIASVYLSDELARHSQRIVDAYEAYEQLRVLRRPLEGVYLSFFLGLTLLILISATWMGLYLAKRITRPVQRLAAGAREIGAGHLDHRIEPETHDEFGALVEAFNKMAGELDVSRQRLERSRLDLERKSQEAEGRRRYLETILERIATGVVCFDARAASASSIRAAQRLLALDADAIGRPAATVFAREILRPLRAVPCRAAPATDGCALGPPEEVTLVRDGQESHLLGDRHGASRRRARRRDRAGRRRRDAADAGAESGGLARRRAPAGARDQEPADADPVVGRAAAAALQRRAGADPPPGRRVLGRHRRRGRVAQVAGRRVLAVRADAGAEDGPDRSQRAAAAKRSGSTRGCSSARGSSRGRRPAAARAGRPGAGSGGS